VVVPPLDQSSLEASRQARWRRGFLAALAVGAVSIVLLGVLVFQWLNPEPVRVRSSAADFAPWPAPLALVGERLVLGSPAVSSETAPRVERRYLLVRAQAGDVNTTAALVAAHLDSLGWKMTPREGNGGWFMSSSTRSPQREEAFVGPLADYLSDESWAADDGNAPDELRRLAAPHISETVVVQIFGSGR
jgi:hypothetical protein